MNTLTAARKPVAFQSRPITCASPGSGLLPEGVFEAKLVDVRCFANAFGERVGLVFEIVTGPHKGIELMESAAPKSSSRGKLAELLRGLGGEDGALPTAYALLGRQCRVAIRHEATKTGKPYAAIVQTFR